MTGLLPSKAGYQATVTDREPTSDTYRLDGGSGGSGIETSQNDL